MRNTLRWIIFPLLIQLTIHYLSAQDVCDDPPAGTLQRFQTSVWGGALGGDPFVCGTLASPTPLTCALYNRVYTAQESSCINRQQGTNLPDYLPSVYGATQQSYLSDLFTVGNWAGNLGNVSPTPKTWFTLWDHVANDGTTSYIGYYAAQSDMVAFGEGG